MVVLTRVSPVTVGLCIVLFLMGASAKTNNNNGGGFEVKVCSSGCIQQLGQSVTNQRGQLQDITTDIGAAQLANQELETKLQAANDRIDRLFIISGWLYRFDWLETPCISADDCPDGIDATCFKGKCLCTPGYFYSNGQNVCVEKCSQSDQLGEFLKYPGSYIYGFNLDNPAINETQCLARCADDPLCPTVDYSETEGCWLNTVTALQVPSYDFITTGNDYDLYHKRCV